MNSVFNISNPFFSFSSIISSCFQKVQSGIAKVSSFVKSFFQSAVEVQVSEPLQPLSQRVQEKDSKVAKRNDLDEAFEEMSLDAQQVQSPVEDGTGFDWNYIAGQVADQARAQEITIVPSAEVDRQSRLLGGPVGKVRVQEESYVNQRQEILTAANKWYDASDEEQLLEMQKAAKAYWG